MQSQLPPWHLQPLWRDGDEQGERHRAPAPFPAGFPHSIVELQTCSAEPLPVNLVSPNYTHFSRVLQKGGGGETLNIFLGISPVLQPCPFHAVAHGLVFKAGNHCRTQRLGD